MYLMQQKGYLILMLCLPFVRCQEKRSPLKFEDVVSKDYDHLESPMRNGNPATVYVRVVLLKIRNMDASDMVYTADIIFSQFWTDFRLRFPESVNKSLIILDPEWRNRIWTPKLVFKNAVAERPEHGLLPSFYLKMWNNSRIQVKIRASLDLICSMDLRDFPHDTQACEIFILSCIWNVRTLHRAYSIDVLTHEFHRYNLDILGLQETRWTDKAIHTIDELIVLWDKSVSFRGSKHLLLPQFNIGRIQTDDCCNFTYDYGSFSCVVGVVHLNRLVGFYTINIYVPTVLIVAMSMLTFWMPPDAVPARVTLGVTSLLTMITKQYGASMPNVSYVIALNVWLSACIAFVFCGLLEYAIVLALCNYQKYKREEFIECTSSKISPVTPKAAFYAREKYETAKKNDNMPWWQTFPPVKIDQVSRFVFPAMFISYITIYCMLYTS